VEPREMTLAPVGEGFCFKLTRFNLEMMTKTQGL